MGHAAVTIHLAIEGDENGFNHETGVTAQVVVSRTEGMDGEFLAAAVERELEKTRWKVVTA